MTSSRSPGVEVAQAAPAVAPEVAGEVAPSALPALTPAGLIALQRSIGNRATAALIARHNGDAGVAPAGGVQDFMSLIAERRWEDAVRALRDMSADARVAQLNQVLRTDLEALRDQAARMGPDFADVRDGAETARVRRLGLDWDEAVRAGRWQEAVTLVQAYNDIDLPLKLQALTYDQIAALCQQADRMLPAYARVRTAAEPIRVAKVVAEYTAAVAAADWPRAALLLNAFNDADVVTRVDALPQAGLVPMRAAAEAQRASWGARVVSALNRRMVADGMQAMADPSAPTRATWNPSGNDPAATDFSGWAMAATEGPFTVVTSTSINCWEMVLYAAWRAGAINWAWIHSAYMAAAPDWYAELGRRLTPRGTQTYDRTTKLPLPGRGAIVLFDGVDHVALATGASDATGTHVWSFWPPPGPGGRGTVDVVKDVTIEALLPTCDRLAQQAGRAQCVVTFGNPPW